MNKIVSNILTVLHRREKIQLWVLIVLDVMISVLDILFIALLLYIINFYTQPDYSKQHSHFFFNLVNKNPILLVAVFFFCFSIKNFLGFLIFKKQNDFVYAVASRISKNNLENYLHNSYLNYVHVDSSVHIRKIGQEPIEFGHYVLRSLQQIIGQSVLILITIIAMFLFNAMLFLILFLILLPPVILISYSMKRWLASAKMHTKRTSEKSIQHLYEALSGFIESNVYHKHTFFTNRYAQQQQQLNKHLSLQQNIQGMPSRLIEVFAVFGLFVLIVINSVYANTIQIITIGAFMAAAYKIIPGIVKILNSAGQIKTYEFAIDNLLINNHTVAGKAVHYPVNEIDSIEFINVSFKYEEHEVLQYFNMQINEGDIAGISAISGKGKTTIINLLLGFLKPSEGVIYMNGQFADELKRQSFWANIAYVKQQPFLIHDSILKNITLEENVDQQRLSAAIEMSGLEEFINLHPEGYYAMIDENGKNISGGQRQRIVLARAFYKEFDMLILDEPFKELDEVSEITIMKQLQLLAANGKIIILVTHNSRSLSFCNKIISLGDE